MNIIIIISIILFICAILFVVIGLNQRKQNKALLTEAKTIRANADITLESAKESTKQSEQQIQEANQVLQQAQQLKIKHSADQAKVESDLQHAKQELKDTLSSLSRVHEERRKAQEMFEQDSAKAADNYFNFLEMDYVQKEESYNKKIEKLRAAVAQCQDELDKIRDNRAAAMEALRKEKQVKEDKSQYSLQPSLDDLNDIKILSRIRNELKKPRILAMLVWQTYYQPIAKKKFVEILGKDTVCGIYKITNQLTDQCYIGQSVDIYKRWNDHVKCGLGIDTPSGNKLYKSMAECGVENFTFELLQQCNRDELDQQEKYFISLYESDKFGFNSTKGNG